MPIRNNLFFKRPHYPTILGSSGTSSLSDLTSDWRPASFRIWAVQDATNQLLRINPATGSATVVGTFTATGIRAIAFDVTTEALYVTDSTNLFLVDPATAATSLIGATGSSNLFSLGFDLTGTLFAVSLNSLVKINPVTGNAMTVGAIGVNAIVDLAAGPEDGVMFAVANAPQNVYRVNTTSGAATLVGLPTGGLNGLAFSPAVPEPPSMLLLIASLAASLSRRRKSVPHNPP